MTAGYLNTFSFTKKEKHQEYHVNVQFVIGLQ